MISENNTVKMNPSNDKPLIIFFILSLAAISLLALPGILDNYGVIELNIPLLPVIIIGSWSPNLMAFLVIAFVIKQKGGIRALLRRWTIWKVSP